MKYAILGSGGIGGCIGGFLAHQGYDVTFLARGANLEALQTKGLTIHSGLKGDLSIPQVKACSTEAYQEEPDVIFLTVKGYSIEPLLPFLTRYENTKTIIIPLLNIYGTGEYLKAKLPNLKVVSGCIYIVAHLKNPGEVVQEQKIFRIVMGTHGEDPLYDELAPIAEDLISAGIKVNLTKDISGLAFKKFAFISPFAATGAYYDYTAGEIRQNEESLALFKGLIAECSALAVAMGINITDDLQDAGLITLEAMGEKATASMQKDMALGKQSEVEGLVHQPLLWGAKYGVATPNYAKVYQQLQNVKGA